MICPATSFDHDLFPSYHPTHENMYHRFGSWPRGIEGGIKMQQLLSSNGGWKIPVLDGGFFFNEGPFSVLQVSFLMGIPPIIFIIFIRFSMDFPFIQLLGYLHLWNNGARSSPEFLCHQRLGHATESAGTWRSRRSRRTWARRLPGAVSCEDDGW